MQRFVWTWGLFGLLGLFGLCYGNGAVSHDERLYELGESLPVKIASLTEPLLPHPLNPSHHPVLFDLDLETNQTFKASLLTPGHLLVDPYEHIPIPGLALVIGENVTCAMFRPPSSTGGMDGVVSHIRAGLKANYYLDSRPLTIPVWAGAEAYPGLEWHGHYRPTPIGYIGGAAIIGSRAHTPYLNNHLSFSIAYSPATESPSQVAISAASVKTASLGKLCDFGGPGMSLAQPDGPNQKRRRRKDEGPPRWEEIPSTLYWTYDVTWVELPSVPSHRLHQVQDLDICGPGDPLAVDGRLFHVFAARAGVAFAGAGWIYAVTAVMSGTKSSGGSKPLIGSSSARPRGRMSAFNDALRAKAEQLPDFARWVLFAGLPNSMLLTRSWEPEYKSTHPWTGLRRGWKLIGPFVGSGIAQLTTMALLSPLLLVTRTDAWAAHAILMNGFALCTLVTSPIIASYLAVKISSMRGERPSIALCILAGVLGPSLALAGLHSRGVAVSELLLPFSGVLGISIGTSLSCTRSCFPNNGFDTIPEDYNVPWGVWWSAEPPGLVFWGIVIPPMITSWSLAPFVDYVSSHVWAVGGISAFCSHWVPLAVFVLTLFPVLAGANLTVRSLGLRRGGTAFGWSWEWEAWRSGAISGLAVFALINSFGLRWRPWERPGPMGGVAYRDPLVFGHFMLFNFAATIIFVSAYGAASYLGAYFVMKKLGGSVKS